MLLWCELNRPLSSDFCLFVLLNEAMGLVNFGLGDKGVPEIEHLHVAKIPLNEVVFAFGALEGELNVGRRFRINIAVGARIIVIHLAICF